MRLGWLLKDPWYWVHALGCYFLTTVAFRIGASRLVAFLIILAVAILWELLVDLCKLIPQLADERGPDAWDVVVSMVGITGALLIRMGQFSSL